MRIGVSVVLLLLCWMSAFSAWAEPDEITKKGCRDCHRFSSEGKQTPKGPDLFYAGDKFHRNWLKGFLQSPIVIRKMAYVPGLDYFKGKFVAGQPHVAFSKEESERISDFLVALRMPGLETGKIDDEPLSKGDRAQAKMLFERKLGCIACHEALNLVGKVRGGVSGLSLIDSGLRLKPDWVFHWLRTPKKFLSKGRMPVYDLDEKTTIQITKYILSIRSKR